MFLKGGDCSDCASCCISGCCSGSPSCYFTNMQASSTEAAVGTTVDVTAIQKFNSFACGLKKQAATAPKDPAAKDVWVGFAVAIIGPANFIISEPTKGKPGTNWPKDGFKKTRKGRPQVQDYSANIETFFPDTNGLTLIPVNVTGAGCITVYVSAYEDGFPAFADYVQINCECKAPPPPVDVVPVASLRLLPFKAYRHVHDPITLTVQALDSEGAPAVGAKVAISAFGDCLPHVDPSVVVTDSKGLAAVEVTAHELGVASLVAAGVDENGVAVLSPATHIFFFTDRHHADKREAEYYSYDSQAHGERYVGVCVSLPAKPWRLLE